MAKVEVYCKIKRRIINIDKKLADALVKMKRASYDLPEDVVSKKNKYDTRMMSSNLSTPIVPVQTPPPPPVFNADENVIKSEVEDQKEEVIVNPPPPLPVFNNDEDRKKPGRPPKNKG